MTDAPPKKDWKRMENGSVKVGMVSLGCPKNQVDAEILLALLKKGGYELTNDAGSADVVVINTCGFIESAKQESIDNILEFCELKKEGKLKCVVVTGCLAERYRDEVAKEIPEADVVLGIGSNIQIVSAIEQALSGERVLRFGKKTDLPLEGERVLSTLPYYAYLKIAEGCSNGCSYCAIPMIRGKFRSRSMESILAEAEGLATRGVKELVVVAQDTSRYGEDLYGESKLPELLEALCRIEGFVWIRTLYCYPERITDRLLDVIAKEDKLVKYLDIPLQHCSGHVLEAMNRSGDRKSLTALMKKIRERIPGMTLRTTLIAGFPGETKEDFAELMDFVHETAFERLGCFAYSAEEGTKAAAMENQVPEKTKLRRADHIMEQQMFINEKKNRAELGKVKKTIVEGYDKYGGVYFGRTESDAPDIDGKIFFHSEKKLQMGDFVNVLVEDVLDYDLIGTVTD